VLCELGERTLSVGVFPRGADGQQREKCNFLLEKTRRHSLPKGLTLVLQLGLWLSGGTCA
jgi:hypothetical protein